MSCKVSKYTQVSKKIAIFFHQRVHVVVLHHQHLPQAMVVDPYNGKGTIRVMMKTIMKPVTGMVVIAAVIM